MDYVVYLDAKAKEKARWRKGTMIQSFRDARLQSKKNVFFFHFQE